MQKSFLPDSVKCRELFNDEEDLYRIPRYQRPYSWEKEHINQLLDDLYEAWTTEPESPYFLGSIIVVNESGKDRLSILDGQQRVTTLTIIYAVLNDRFSDHLSDTNQKLVRSRIIEKDLEKPRLRSDKQADFERSVLDQLRLDEANRYTNAANIVIDNLQDKFDDAPDELDGFFRFIDRKIELIRIHTSDLTHAVRLFQTINTRGKDLTVSDLTKSYLLSNLEDDEDKDDVIEVWQELTGKIDDNYDLLDDILGMYRLYLRATKQKESAYVELKAEFEGQNPKDIVRDIRDFVATHQDIENTRDRWIFMLDNLTHKRYWKTILIAAKKDGVDYYDQLKEDLVAFYYSYWIGDYTAEKIKLPSITILEKVKDKADLTEIEQFMAEKRDKDNIPGRVRDGLNADNVYGERWHKRLLVAIEYLLSTGQKVERIDPGKDLHREHVLPKEYKSAKLAYDYWGKKFDDGEAERLKHTLGNLVPLQYDLNSSAAQKPFPQKTKIYKGDADDKPQSSFDLTLRVADTDNYTEWTPTAIEDNRDFLLQKTANLLHLSIEDLKPADEAIA